MAAVTQLTAILGALLGILIIFNALHNQYNAKLAAFGLIHSLTILLLFASLAAQRFSSIGVGILAFFAAIATLLAGVMVYRNSDQKNVAPLTTAYAVSEVVTLALVLGSAGLGIYT